MKVFVVLCIALSVAAAEVTVQQVVAAKWSNFKATHGKEYHPSVEAEKLNAFLKHTEFIENHNEKFAKGEVSFEIGHNEHSDMTHEAFKATRMGLIAPPENHLENATLHQSVGLGAPAACDWKAAGKVTPIKNQGGCGSCYTFAAAGALETAFAKKTGKLVALSEQNLLDCSGKNGNFGCNGGYMTAAFEYVRQSGGINSMAQYPYEERVNACRYNAAQKVTGLSSYVSCRDEAALQNALSTVGAVSIGIDAGPQAFMLYKRGVFGNKHGCKQTPSHAVLAVGMGEDAEGPYYLVKNSWGTTWGDAGYFKLARNQNACGVTSMASYPVV